MKFQVDAQMLQFQNHKLAQQLVVTRNEIDVLEGKLNQLRSKQASFDENLSTVNRVWNQVRFQKFCSMVRWSYPRIIVIRSCYLSSVLRIY